MRFLVAAFLLFTFSCKNVSVDRELLQIDSLEKVVTVIEAQLKEIDIAQLEKTTKVMSADLDVLREHFNDSLEWDLAKFLSEYHRTNKSIGKYIKQNNYFKREIIYSKEQLSNLRNDLSKNILSADSFNIYIKVEAIAMEELRTTTKSKISLVKASIKAYEDSKPRIKEIILQIAEDQ